MEMAAEEGEPPRRKRVVRELVRAGKEWRHGSCGRAEKSRSLLNRVKASERSSEMNNEQGGPLGLVIRRAWVTSAMMTSRREGRVEAWVTWGWRGKARSRSGDRNKKKKKEAKTERANCFFFLWGLLFSGSRATGCAAGET